MNAARVFGVFLRLGLTSFGGPTAHLGFFHTEFVTRRRWLDEAAYADLVALCQFLPGPASSQAGIAIGYLRAGYRGAAMAWLGFTAPSAVLMVLFAYGLAAGWGGEAAWLHALKLVAVAVVAQAAWTMGRSLWTDRRRTAIGMVAAIVLLLVPLPAMQLAVIAAGALAGRWLLATAPATGASPAAAGVSPVAVGVPSGARSPGRRTGALLAGTFAVSVVALPFAAAVTEWPALAVFDAFYRAGALVFGGGHVVLPLLEAEVVAPGWVGRDEFLAGYGAAQALPGPLFTIAAFLGAHIPLFESPTTGALVALVAIFAPSFLARAGAAPVLERAPRAAGRPGDAVAMPAERGGGGAAYPPPSTIRCSRRACALGGDGGGLRVGARRFRAPVRAPLAALAGGGARRRRRRDGASRRGVPRRRLTVRTGWGREPAAARSFGRHGDGVAPGNARSPGNRRTAPRGAAGSCPSGRFTPRDA